MKKLIPFLMLGMLILTACVAVPPAEPTQGFLAPVANGLVAMPDELNVLVVSLITAGLTWVLFQAGLALNLDLTGYLTPLLAVVSPIIITLIENGLGTIPPAFDNIVLTVIHLGILLLGSLGGMLMIRRKARATLIGEG